MKIVLESAVFLFMIKLAQQSPKTAVTSEIPTILTHIPILVTFNSKLSNVAKVSKIVLLLNLHIFHSNLLFVVYCEYSNFLDVCYLRLDFESFDINGLTDTLEYTDTNGPVTACTDKFTITVIKY